MPDRQQLGKSLGRVTIRRAIERNLERRRIAAAEVDAARVELEGLIRAGRAPGVEIGVTELAGLADMSRERVYEILRGKERRSSFAGRPRTEREETR